MHLHFVDAIACVEENVNNEIFREYFRCQMPSYLAKDFFIADMLKNQKIVNQVNDSLIDQK